MDNLHIYIYIYTLLLSTDLVFEARVLRERGDLHQAKELYEKAVDGMRASLGNKHLETWLQFTSQ